MKIIPLFPLNLVVFPHEKLNLHIFEPRYLQLVKECDRSRGQKTFGIPPVINGCLMNVGTEMRLISIEKTYPNGEMDIRTEGVGTFEIQEKFNVLPGKLYTGASVVPRELLDENGDFMTQSQILQCIREMFKVIHIQKRLPEYVSDFFTFEFGHYVGFTMTQEYEFLCLTDEHERQNYMLEHLENILPTVREMERLRERAQLNGHFRAAIPPNF
jgi:hypothetical protein